VPPGSGVLGVYAETQLAPRRRAVIPQSSAFSNLDFALYLGRSQQGGNLLEATTGQLPIVGPKATTLVPFANTDLTLVGTATQPLAGALSRELTFFVILFGAVLTIGAAVMTERLVRRRRSAETLAEENRQLYGEQQTLASALQRALLPKAMPDIPGLEIATRYEAGLEAMDIGGDWFDLIAGQDGGFIFVVGDVSGRGVEAAVVMASLHYAIRAYAAEGDSAGSILTKLCSLLDVSRDGHFATVLCCHIDGEKRELTLASAGHFAPVLVSKGKGSFVELVTGPPIGTVERATYPATTVALPPEWTLVAFTDGLIERKGRVIDSGLAQLREAVSGDDQPLSQLLTNVVSKLTPEGSEDDIAILGLRWTK
jgi:serine phosphatase RsbU (regulator of sigma subunit)